MSVSILLDFIAQLRCCLAYFENYILPDMPGKPNEKYVRYMNRRINNYTYFLVNTLEIFQIQQNRFYLHKIYLRII
jgi:hypothetical protein